MLDFFEALQYSPLLTALRDLPWFFPLIASMHLMGLALLGGAVLMTNLRLLGLGLREQSVALVARDAERWLFVSLAMLLPTGILQFMCFAATKYYYLSAFWVKLAALSLALTFHFTVHRRVALCEVGQRSAVSRKTASLVSLFLWTSVAVAGRLIGLP
jgi:hypothetical protein